MQVLKDDLSPCILLNGSKAHALIVCERKPRVVAFAQNTREEVRVLGGDGNVAGALSAESGTHQTTYLYVRKRKSVPRGTKKNSKVHSECFDTKRSYGMLSEECSHTILESCYKEPPAVIRRET